MLVKLTGGVFEHAQEDGDDILFTAADGTTKLLHEIESVNGEVVAWVQMPNLSEKEDTVLYVYYGNATAENQQQPTNVWDPNKYVGVWHTEGSSVAQVDSSTQRNDVAAAGSDFDNSAVDGLMGPAVRIDGSDGHYTTSGLTGSISGDVTLSTWIRTSQKSGFRFIDLDDTAGRKGIELYVVGGANPGRIVLDGAGSSAIGPSDDVISTGNTFGNNEWHQMTVTREGSTFRLYTDGVEVGSTAGGTGEYNRIFFGRRSDNTSLYNGDLDEIRLKKEAVSHAWIKTEYNNQCGCEDFLTIGETETQSATTTAAVESTSSTPASFSPLIQAINQLYRTAYNRGPTFAEWKLWAERVIANDKTTFPGLLGAMQWQSLFGQ